ncbi:MAG: hypothetical protein FJ303_20550 [Planctomycetes bacterium]|nr:hypothetical protein [Planctomycetota bacterium]
MQIELYCDCCACRFVAPPDASCEDVVDRMFETGPWYALGDGATFEDMIFSSLTEYGQISCPECGDAVAVSEESLGRLAMSMLSQM